MLETKQNSVLINVFMYLLVGCIITCYLNIIVNNLQYGNTIVKLDKDFDTYKNNKSSNKSGNNIPIGEATNINFAQILKWDIIPTIINLTVWGTIIWHALSKTVMT